MVARAQYPVFLNNGTGQARPLAWNQRQRELATVALVSWEVGVAGPEEESAHSEAKRRSGYGALRSDATTRRGQVRFVPKCATPRLAGQLDVVCVVR